MFLVVMLSDSRVVILAFVLLSSSIVALLAIRSSTTINLVLKLAISGRLKSFADTNPLAV